MVINPSASNTVEERERIEELINRATMEQTSKYGINVTNSNSRSKTFEIDSNPLTHSDGFIYKQKLEIGDKVIMFGDFHGSFHTFFRLMIRLVNAGILDDRFRLAEGYYILFCGDILDRGQYALEIVTFILNLIINNDGRVIYNRGNHEYNGIYTYRGFGNLSFIRELKRKGIVKWI